VGVYIEKHCISCFVRGHVSGLTIVRSSALYNPIVILVDLIIALAAVYAMLTGYLTDVSSDRPKLDQTKSDTGVGVSPRVMFCLGSCRSGAVTALGSVQAEPCVAIFGG
jgi:hypothetical protein